ncbi:hypothetical protein [Ornithinibacillus californiensis]|uniref:hypothetical protein n=1 Tax=Ornithinibacillus californiensis TaxID=161536 RepID=UPI00064D7C2B|nr:hypothetical protein [Ornithinibacillus californiensis]
MFKFVSVMLLLVICFLVGAIVGIDYNGKAVESIKPTAIQEVTETQAQVQQTVNETVQEPEVVNQQVVAQELSNSNPDHLSQKTASFLEVIVQGFYDLIVQILYQISQLFF